MEVLPIVHPDKMLDSPYASTFIYSNGTKRLHITDQPITHDSFARTGPNELRTLSRLYGSVASNEGETRWDCLCGRVGVVDDVYGVPISIVSAFWHEGDINKDRTYRNLGDVLRQLKPYVNDYMEDHPDIEDYFVSIPSIGTVRPKDLDIAAPTIRYNVGPRWDLNMGQDKPKEKIIPTHDPHPWHTVVKKAGYSYPPFGEGEFEKEVNRIIEQG